MTTTTATAAAPVERAGSGVVGAVRDAFPLRAVVLPWLLARLALVPALVLGGPGRGVVPGELITMDGQWFRLIALDWYDRPYTPGLWSEYPFFPLFPGASGALMQLGMPSTVALAGLSWLAALIASAGAYRLAQRHLDPTVAAWVPWFVALAPGGVALVMGYADALWLAATLWALILAEDRRWWACGVVAALATASRPNGLVTVAALIVVVLVARAGWRAAVACVVPSAVFLAGWLWWLHDATGDAFVFWSAKDAWDELSLGGLLGDPLGHEVGLFHFVVALVVLVPYAMRARHQPLAWAVVVIGVVGPPLVLGVEGLARYVTMAFPIPFAVADVLVSRSRALAAGFLAVSGGAAVALALLVVNRSWVP